MATAATPPIAATGWRHCTLVLLRTHFRLRPLIQILLWFNRHRGDQPPLPLSSVCQLLSTGHFSKCFGTECSILSVKNLMVVVS
ncbi:hypothetical protein AAHC03_022935 [Spirometra sp. Aus1]